MEPGTESTRLVEALEDAAACYPHALAERERGRIASGRYPYEARLMLRAGSRVVDLGGGVAATSLALASLGCEVHLVDDYCRPYYAYPPFREVVSLLRERVHVVEADLLETDLGFLEDGSVDVIASFQCLEHLHHSPRAVLRAAVRKLRPGGTLLVSVPNSVNLAKRARVLLGRTNASSLDEFYERGTPFTGHVREFTASELRTIARRLGLGDVRIAGRNWMGYAKYRSVPPSLKRGLDRLLRMRPELCSNLYLEASKPGTRPGRTDGSAT